MKKIKLTKGYFALVDDEDFEYLNQFNWYYHVCGYAVRNSKGIKILMHREILGLKYKNKQIIDHKDRNRLNNQRLNLRCATAAQNSQNSKATGKSKYIGVGILNRPNGKKQWRSNICINNKQMFLGNFDYNDVGEKNAAKAYNEAAIKYFGKEARINNV